MTEPLALKYRPRSFEDIVGQPVVRTVLSKMVSDRTVPSGLLFTGVRGAGKTTTGRIVAAGLNCEKHPVGPCGHCPSCSAVFGGNSLDVIEIDAASSGLVADVRTLTEMVQYSTGGEYRVVLIDEALALDELVPTPTGIRKISEVQPGDWLIGSSGSPVQIVRKTPVFHGKQCFRVHFDTGDSVVVSANHQWLCRPIGYGRKNGQWRSLSVRTTEQMVGRKFAVPQSPAWDLPSKIFELPPYLLGLWLGDGSTGQCHIAGEQDDLEHYARRLEEMGVGSHFLHRTEGKVGRLAFSHPYGPRGLKGSAASQALIRMPCFRDKHIPPEYFLGSVQQRLDLLQGLMDTDGHVTKTGHCCFVGTDRLSQDIQRLLTTLGITSRRIFRPDARSRVGGYWKVHFQPHSGLYPVSLPRKRERVVFSEVRSGSTPGWRTITHVESVESVPVQCVEVAAEDHLFTLGSGVLTHNCHSMSREGFNALLKTLEEPPERTVFVLLTTEPHRILDTIVSRCMSFDFRKITVTDIVGRLEHIVASEGIEMQPEVLPLIAGRSDGGLRDAVMTLDQCVRAGVTTVSGFKSLVGDSDFAPGIIEAILDQDLALAYERVDSVVGKVGEPSVVISALTRALKDVVVLNSNGQIDAVGEEYEARKRLAVRMPVPLAVGWMRVLWSVKTNIRMDDSPVALIYLATALLGEVGKRPTSAPQSSSAPIVRQEKRRLSLDEMRSMAQ